MNTFTLTNRIIASIALVGGLAGFSWAGVAEYTAQAPQSASNIAEQKLSDTCALLPESASAIKRTGNNIQMLGCKPQTERIARHAFLPLPSHQ